ncbi:outer membrane protein assembly factor BamE domain-containing protein [Citrobacter amalonaticus]|uniref:OmpA family protein n=1 Tax=Citrobacter amalonaticus TaxID=35703 RepID=UPI00300CB68A
MLTKLKALRLGALAFGMTLVSGCTHSVSDVDTRGKTNKPVFPAPETAVRSEGSYVNLDNLKQVQSGMTKNQLYELIGIPHFKEGTFRVKEWDYIFHFTKADKSVLTCQYKVLFDSDMKARSFYFKPDNCLSQLNDTRPIASHQVKHQELGTEGLFAFGSTQLLSTGAQRINHLAADVKAEGFSGKHIVISGHSDRIGSPLSNQALSLARAETVKSLFVQNGIPAGMIETRGLGDSQPKVQCPGKPSPAVIECLAENRRIVVDVIDTNSGKE